MSNFFILLEDCLLTITNANTNIFPVFILPNGAQPHCDGQDRHLRSPSNKDCL